MKKYDLFKYFIIAVHKLLGILYHGRDYIFWMYLYFTQLTFLFLLACMFWLRVYVNSSLIVLYKSANKNLLDHKIQEKSYVTFLLFGWFIFSLWCQICKWEYAAEEASRKENLTTSEATCFVRTKISFALVKSLVLCIRGFRRARQRPCPASETDIVLINQISGAKE